MKIVVLDGYAENPGDLRWDALAQLGELTVYDRTPQAQIIPRIGDAEIVFTNKTPLDESIFAACPRIRFIGVLATGYNIVDCAAAAARGIPVSNVPGYGTAAVAQFTFALLLELCHHVGHHSDAVHQGRWTAAPDFCFWDNPLVELSGKTLGILGFGSIGRAVGRIARAMGMEVLAAGSRPTEAGMAIARYVELDELLEQSDVLSLHCPLFPENTGIINRNTISKMKDGAMLINTARGGLLVEQDVANALNCGKLSGAAMDVASTEPIQPDNPLLNAKNCILTPHIAWAPKEARQRIMDISAENLRAFLSGSPIHVVNEAALSRPSGGSTGSKEE